MKNLQEIIERNKARQKSDTELDANKVKPDDDNKAGKEDKVPAGGKTLTGQQHNEIDLEPTVVNKAAIKESKDRAAVITFGRMNPPTVGHQKLVNKLVDIAAAAGAKPMVFLSRSEDKKNPIPYDHKLAYARRAFGNIVKPSPKVATLMTVVKELDGQCDHLTVVVGSDRIQEVSKKLQQYNGKDYNFSKIDVVSAGERDPDSDGVEGMSASKMRALAKANDSEGFKNGLPTALRSIARMVFDSVLLEEDMLEGEALTEALDAQQRMKRAIQFKRLHTRIEAGRQRALRRRAPKSALVKRARRTAIKFMRKRITRGHAYGEMSYGQRAQVDKQLARRRKSIGRIAKRLLPRVARAEATRKLGSNFKSINSKVNEETLLEFVQWTMLSVSEEHDYEFSPVETEVLTAKAELHDLPVDVIETVYRRGIAAWELTESDLTFQQYAFNRVNSFLSGGAAYDLDYDLIDEADSPLDFENEPLDGHLDNYKDDMLQTRVAKDNSNPITHRTTARPGKKSKHQIIRHVLDEVAKATAKPKVVPGAANKEALDKHLTKHENLFKNQDNVRAKEAIGDIHKLRSLSPNKLVAGIKPHLDHLEKLSGFVQGSNAKPDLSEAIELDHTYDYGDHAKITLQGHAHSGKKVRVHQISPTGTHVGVEHPKTGKHLGYFHVSDLKKLDEEALAGEKRRCDMPQLTDFHAFKADLESAGHKMTDASRKPTDLEPSQKHFNQEKVDKLIADKAHTAKPIIVSKDDKIIDGHHRWEACRQAGCDVKTRQTSLKADELFDFVKGKPYVEKKTLHESYSAEMAAEHLKMAKKHEPGTRQHHNYMAQAHTMMAHHNRTSGHPAMADEHDRIAREHDREYHRLSKDRMIIGAHHKA